MPPNPFIALGLSVHRALEQFHSRTDPTLDALLDSFDAAWVNEGFVSPQQTQEFYEKGQRMLRNYYEESVSSKSEIICVEKAFSFRLGRNSVRGIIDRIDRHPDGNYEVIDYKTHAEMWKKEKLDSDLQLSMYALACEKALGFRPTLLSYYFLAHGRKVSAERSPAQIADAVRIIEDVARRISRSDFTPNLRHCAKCDFRKQCRHSNSAKERGISLS